MADAELETLTGTVEKLNCQKPTFCAGRIRSGGRDVSFSVRGHCALGDTVTVHGQWEVDPKWGRQFKGKHLVPSLPLDTRGLRKWIEYNVPHVGVVTASRLVDEFGLELMDKCAADPQAVAIAGRCPLESINYMAEEWRKASVTIGTVSWLMGHGLTEKQAKAVFTRYGPSSVSVVQADPYELIGTVDGFGWIVTDALAKSLGIVGEDPRRMRGSVVAVVREKQDDGSTCVNVRGACNLAGDRMNLSGDLFLPHIESVVAEKRLVRFGDGTEETDWLATTQAYRNEAFIWKSLQRSRERNPFLSPNEDAGTLAEQYRKMPGLTLDDTQVAAVASVLKYRLSALCGAAGSGKTACTKAILNAFESRGVRVLLCSPTGKAARRMTEVVGHPAHTIHRLLGYRGGVLGNGESQFTWNKDRPLNEYVVIVDEASMIDSSLAYHLLSALGPKTSIVFVGDPNQLPPVGAGSMLRDIIAHNLAPVVQLGKCHRQAGPLKENCVAVLEGRIANSVVAPKDAQGSPTGTSPWLVHHGVTTDSELRGALKAIVTKMLAEWNCAESPMQSQFMAAKKDGEFGVKQMNLILQHLYQKDVPEPLPGAWKVPPTIRKGDKVIQGRNNYDLNVMNGETGIVRGINLTHDELMIELGFVAPPVPPAAEFASTLFAPILPVTDGRETLCPVCLAVREIVAAGGWHEMRCARCGTEYVATDGSAPPKVRPRRDVLDEFVPAEPAKRRKFREEDVIADYVVAFPDRVVSYPKGTGGDLELAYCVTIHRMQGSQMPCAITLVHKSMWFMQNRSLLYTAVTRATRTCVLLGDKISMDRAAEKVVVDERETLLRCFAQSEQSRP